MESDWNQRYGDWAIVTGASSGLGADFVRQLARKKMNIVLVARRVDRMNAIAEEIENECGVKTQVIGQDLIKPDAVENIIKEVEEKEIGVLINNAGYGILGNFHENDYDYQVEMVKLNCVAPVALTNAFIKPMVRRGKGAIIFLLQRRLTKLSRSLAFTRRQRASICSSRRDYGENTENRE